MSFRTPLALSLLAFAACQPSGTAVLVERLDVPAEVQIIDVEAGVSTLAAFDITNAGAGGARVELRVGGPFFVTTPSLFVPAGESVTVRVGVRDEGYATVIDTIEVVGPFDTASIPISATFDLDLDDDGFLTLAAGGSDCDDEDPGAHPAASELCNDRDDDCDTLVDEDAIDTPAWFADHDADGFGDPDQVLVQCDHPMGFDLVGGDCDDEDPAVHPGAFEVFYDGVDQDCSASSDFDRDGDGFDHVLFDGTDCRDTDGSIHPGAPEADDLIDQDCDGLTDEDFLVHGDVVITEIFVAPTAADATDGQYVEILNPSATRTLQLRGWVVETNAGIARLTAATLPPGQVGLLCGSVKPGANGGLTCVGLLPGLLDAHDWIRITAAEDLDEVDWSDDEWKMLPGISLKLSTVDATANDDFASWCYPEAPATVNTDSGSPGDAVATCALAAPTLP